MSDNFLDFGWHHSAGTNKKPNISNIGPAELANDQMCLICTSYHVLFQKYNLENGVVHLIYSFLFKKWFFNSGKHRNR